MNEFIIEFLKITVAPIAIGISTLFVGSRIREKESKKEQIERENKQINGYYLKLIKLKKDIIKYNDILQQISSYKDEINKIERDEIDLSKEYGPQFAEGKEDLLHQFQMRIEDHKHFTLPEAAEPIINIYSEIKRCAIDEISAEKNFKCREFIEMDYTFIEMLDMEKEIDELITFIEPEYK